MAHSTNVMREYVARDRELADLDDEDERAALNARRFAQIAVAEPGQARPEFRPPWDERHPLLFALAVVAFVAAVCALIWWMDSALWGTPS